MDTEDSLNLTIGEDEAQLLQGEVETVADTPKVEDETTEGKGKPSDEDKLESESTQTPAENKDELVFIGHNLLNLAHKCPSLNTCSDNKTESSAATTDNKGTSHPLIIHLHILSRKVIIIIRS